MKARAKRKLLSEMLALHLVDMAARMDDPEMVQAYWNTYHCQKAVYSQDGKLYGKYCKNRNCSLCNSIRKAVLINKYYPVLIQWPDPCFVTLTVKACSARNLRELMKTVMKHFTSITAKYRKQNQRGKDLKLIGVRSLECCFNPYARTYNPHVHLIVATEEMARIIKQDWRQKWPRGWANEKAQNHRKLCNLEVDLIETIKYGAKIIDDLDSTRKKKRSNNPTIYAAALHNIFVAMKGIRLFERFGFDLPKSNPCLIPARVTNDYNEWVFTAEQHDWVSADSDDVLSSFQPKPGLMNLLDNNIDTMNE